MLDFGFSEILLTSAIALVVLGPERLPKVARQVGNWMGRARAMARQLSDQLEREVNAEELLREQNKYKAPSIPQIPAPTPVSLDPYAQMPAHDPILPRLPLPPEVVIVPAVGAIDSPVPTAWLSSAPLPPVASPAESSSAGGAQSAAPAPSAGDAHSAAFVRSEDNKTTQ